jgi:hypothetical protein
MRATTRRLTWTAGESWEYHVVVLSRADEEQLNRLGDEGWELVAVVAEGQPASSIFYFKRPALNFRERVTLDQKHRYYRQRGLKIPEDERHGQPMN